MYTLLIPVGEIHRESKTGGGPFWDDFWKSKVPENPNFYRDRYQRRVRSSKRTVRSINNDVATQEGKRYYIDVVLSDEKKGSKSNIPKKIWKNSGLEIIATRERDDGQTVLTLGGIKEDFTKFEQLIDQSEFSSAQTGTGGSRDMARELYAVTDIQNSNNTLEGRVDHVLRTLIDQNHQGNLDCLVEVHSDVPLAEYESNAQELRRIVGEERIHLRDSELFISNASYTASLTCQMVIDLLHDVTFNFVSRIRVRPDFVAQRTTPNLELDAVSVGRLLTGESVGLIDSGVSNQVLNPLVEHTHNYLGTAARADFSHGTAVASRLLFGDNFFEAVRRGEAIRPSVRLVDIRVLEEKNGDPTADYESLMKALVECPNRNRDVSIYNFSVAEKEPILDGDPYSEITQLVDTMVHKHDILFVTAVGNQTGNYTLGYEGIFNTGDHSANICAPSDAVNSLSVGSVAKLVADNALCTQEGHPSPFSRKGGIRGDIKKPELVANGGNVQVDPTGQYNNAHNFASKRSFGVEIMTPDVFSKDIGTSLSAPLISREAALLLDYLKKSNLPATLPAFGTNKSNILRSLLVHSTSKAEQRTVEDDGVKRAYGFGEPDFMRAVNDDTENQVTIVYANQISAEEKKHKLMIELPEELIGKSVEFTFSFAYNPPVNKNFKEYNLLKLSPSMRLIAPVMDDGEVADTKVVPLNPSHCWENYRGNQYSTLAHFKKRVRALKCVGLEVLITMTISDYLSEISGDSDILQDYAFVLTVSDLSENGTLRDSIIAHNQIEALIENVVQVHAE